MNKNLAPYSLGITEARTELKKSIDNANGKPIAILHNNNVIAYVVPAEEFEDMVRKKEKNN